MRAHSSELRETIYNPKRGWLAKFHLKMADKVLVATPSILRKVHGYSIFCPSRIKWKFKGQNKFLFALRKLKKMGYDCDLVLVEYTTPGSMKDIEATKNWLNPLELNKM